MSQKNPFFSIVIPVTDKSAYLLPFTLDSILSQDSKAFEIVMIDGTKHEIKVENARIFAAASSNRFAMMNQGILQAKGEYLHFLNPGEFYISNHALAFMEKFIRGHDQPDLIYSGCMVRHSFGQPTVVLNPINLDNLEGGKVPVSLRAFWFQKETLQLMGRLSEKYEIEGGLDIICRIYHSKTLRKAHLRRILTDYEYRRPSSQWVIRQFWETFVILIRYFGLNFRLMKWMWQNYLRLVRWWWKMVKKAFWKQNVAY